MDKIDIILWILGGGFVLMLVMWHNMNNRYDKLENKIDRLENKIDNIEKDVQQLNTRIAVIESRLSDISTNVNHLMWYQQTLPTKDGQEQ